MNRLGPYLLGPNDTDKNGIYTGDARELARRIPDESVDLIFTDPVYDRIDDYRWLAETAARILKPGGSVMALCAHEYLDQVMKVMDASLKYHWICCLWQPGSSALLWKKRIMAKWKPMIWYVKSEPSQAIRWFMDGVVGEGTGSKIYHYWGQPIAWAYWIQRTTTAERFHVVP